MKTNIKAAIHVSSVEDKGCLTGVLVVLAVAVVTMGAAVEVRVLVVVVEVVDGVAAGISSSISEF